MTTIDNIQRTVKLRPKQQRFVDEYLIDLNATQAYKRAYGCSDAIANKSGPRLLVKVGIQLAIQQAMKARKERTRIDQDRVLKELAFSAFFNVKSLFHPCGKPKLPHEMPDETAQAIKIIAIVDNGDGTYSARYQIDKFRALELIGRHLGMFDHSATRKPDNKPIHTNVRELTNEQLAKKLAEIKIKAAPGVH